MGWGRWQREGGNMWGCLGGDELGEGMDLVGKGGGGGLVT